MTSPTHVAGGIIAAQILLNYVHADSHMAIIVVAAAGSILPDIDLPGSLMSNVIKPISVIYNWVEEKVMPKGMQHRGASHTLICIIIMLMYACRDAAITVYVQMLAHTPYTGSLVGPDAFMLALTAGVASHIILDMLTTSGVPLLYPFIRTRLRVCNIKTGSKTEDYVRYVLWAAILCLYIKDVIL